MTYGRATKTDGILRFMALIFAGLFLVGCANAIEGAPNAAEGAAPSPVPTQTTSAEVSWIATVLPTAVELSRVLGSEETSDGVEPLVGDVTDLRDTVSGSQIAVGQCIGAVAPLEKRTFGGAPVAAVSYATRPDATFGAVALSSIEAARSLFNSFVNEWHHCNGKAVVRSDGTGTYTEEVTQVSTSGDVVSAMVALSTTASNT